MTHAFGDTVYFLALLNARDTYHQRAVEYANEPGLRIVTTAWVLCEVVDACSGLSMRRIAGPFVESVAKHPHVRIIPARQSQFERKLPLFASRPDKEWSLTDCISFLVMRQHRLNDALTADRHFRQAGFRALLL